MNINDIDPSDAYDLPAPRSVKDFLWLLASGIRASWPVQGIGTTVTDSPDGNGRVIGANVTGKVSSVASAILPFTIKDHGAANSKVDITDSTLMGLTPTGLTALSVAANDDVYFALTVTRTDRIITSASVAAMAGTGIDYSTTDVDASGGTAVVNIKIGHIDSITSGVTKPSNIGHGPVGVVAEVNWNSLPGSEKVTFGIGINS